VYEADCIEQEWHVINPNREKVSPNGHPSAFAVGGGIDIPVGHVVSIRPAGVDYLLTNFSNRFNNSNQNNFRYTAGINFNLGSNSK
jgi:hypothetical protein